MARKEYLENNRVKQLATDLSAYEKQQPGKWSGGTYGKSVDAALQKILSEERMAVMYIQPDGTAGEEPDDEEEMEE